MVAGIRLSMYVEDNNGFFFLNSLWKDLIVDLLVAFCYHLLLPSSKEWCPLLCSEIAFDIVWA